jgi:phosphoenolpyruvate carboxykinase (ATP)
MGYSSHRQKVAKGVQISTKFQPLFYGNMFIFPPTTYAMLLWERMERSKTTCWLVNSHHIGDLNNDPIFINRKMLLQLIQGVYNNAYKDKNMRKDPVWGFDEVCQVEGIDENHLNPILAWKDPVLFEQRRTQLLDQFKKHFEPFANQLDKSISDIVPN